MSDHVHRACRVLHIRRRKQHVFVIVIVKAVITQSVCGRCFGGRQQGSMVPKSMILTDVHKAGRTTAGAARPLASS